MKLLLRDFLIHFLAKTFLVKMRFSKLDPDIDNPTPRY